MCQGESRLCHRLVCRILLHSGCRVVDEGVAACDRAKVHCSDEVVLRQVHTYYFSVFKLMHVATLFLFLFSLLLQTFKLAVFVIKTVKV